MKEYCICKELHQSGEPHIHALIKFADVFRSRNPRVFDIQGFHPNIKNCRSPEAVFVYVRKGGDFITDIGYKKRTYGDFLRENDTKEDFMKAAKKEMPRDYVLNHEKLEYFCNTYYRQEREVYQPRYLEFPRVAGVMLSWRDEYIGRDVDRPKTLILCGPSRTGKTEWARSLGRHMYFNGQFNLDDWDDDAQYIILDDMNIKYVPNYKAWFGAQRQFVLTDKYRKKRTVKWGKPLIWICNEGEDPRKAVTVNKEWMEKNSTFVFVHNKLY